MFGIPESLRVLKTGKIGGGLLVVHASVRGYRDPFRILIDSGTSTNFAQRQTVECNNDKFADALRESEGRVKVSVRLDDSSVVNVPEVQVDLVVKFEGFDNTESCGINNKRVFRDHPRQSSPADGYKR
ncbi:Hypothetical protein PHPALM_37139 [Phytophthora palmivora]|uniref:Uncharacterized protein n=1 Tax=Phytophthora palmivora TaxID=4796 RepID=A0A2P4WY76_9STRA|nr:Hypothetical protein PHPALM_37139 [Phytophthora palmivora]